MGRVTTSTGPFSSSLCQSLPEGRPPFSYDFPMVLPMFGVADVLLCSTGKAAGVIHTDFEKGFIKVGVVKNGASKKRGIPWILMDTSWIYGYVFFCDECGSLGPTCLQVWKKHYCISEGTIQLVNGTAFISRFMACFFSCMWRGLIEPPKLQTLAECVKIIVPFCSIVQNGWIKTHQTALFTASLMMPSDSIWHVYWSPKSPDEFVWKWGTLNVNGTWSSYFLFTHKAILGVPTSFRHTQISSLVLAG